MGVITTDQFIAAVGRPPEDDDMERCNCSLVGEIGHWSCGWCSKHNLPVFICGCIKIKEMLDGEI